MTKRPKLTTLRPRVAELKPGRPGIRTAVAGSWRTTDQSAASRGYDHRWRQARLDFLAEHPFCACGMLASVVDHIRPHRGDQQLFWERGNWQPMCASCHGRKIVQEQREALGGA